MRAVRRNNLTGNFSWIGSDGWSGRSLVSEGNEPEVEGTLAVLPQSRPVEGFDDYFVSLTPLNNKRNPWFIGKQIALRLTGALPIKLSDGGHHKARRRRTFSANVQHFRAPSGRSVIKFYTATALSVVSRGYCHHP